MISIRLSTKVALQQRRQARRRHPSRLTGMPARLRTGVPAHDQEIPARKSNRECDIPHAVEAVFARFAEEDALWAIRIAWDAADLEDAAPVEVRAMQGEQSCGTTSTAVAL